MLSSIVSAGEITLSGLLICTGVALVLGLGCTALSLYKNRATQSYALTLAILPAIVQMVIMLVNGNIGAGVAVAGAFSLIRFRSVGASAREIGLIFLAMAVGLACGVGYPLVAVVFFLVMSAFILVLAKVDFAGGDRAERSLRITIPEDLDYEGLFDDVFSRYASDCSLEKVKTSGMGTLYELHYRVKLRRENESKEFIDALRTRNGNLTIALSRPVVKEAL